MKRKVTMKPRHIQQAETIDEPIENSMAFLTEMAFLTMPPKTNILFDVNKRY